MLAFLFVGIGGAFGTILRYSITYWCKNLYYIILGTVFINILGSFFVGFLVSFLSTASSNLKIFAITGFCGGFTTFSTYSLQTFQLIRQGAFFYAFLNSIASVFLCFLATTLGYYLGYFLKK